MATVRQTSFATGEISPLLYGRPDIQKYTSALARCRNFYVTRQGQAVSRAGMQFVVQPKANTNDRVRLIPFVYTDSGATENYVLEFGHGYVRFIKDGQQVMTELYGTVPFELATPYPSADLARLKYVQSGDILTLTHGKYPPQELRRYSSTHWALIPAPIGGSTVFAATLGKTGWLHGPFPAPDASHPGIAWRWAFTILYASPDGGILESKAEYVTSLSNNNGVSFSAIPATQVYALSADQPIKLTLLNFGISPYAIYGYRFFRGRGPVMGYVGFLDAFGTFTDSGQDPDYSQPPPEGKNPFLSTSGLIYSRVAKTAATADYPNAVTYFEERLTFAGTDARPTGVFFSRTADYYNFDTPLLAFDATSITIELASRRREEIRSLVFLRKLLAFTNSGVWSLGGANGPLTRTSMEATPQLEVGSNWVDPVVVDGAVLFARSKGTGLRALGYANEQQSYQGFDICIYAKHLFEGREIVDMAYAEDPESLVWVVLDDGTLACLTFVREQDVWAWTVHQTDGQVESVCCIPEGDEDVLYLQVRRGNTGRTIERMASRKRRLISVDAGGIKPIFTQQPFCLDSAVESFSSGYSAYVVGLDHLNGREVMAVADGILYGPFTVTGGGIVLPETVTTAIVGLPYVCEIETLDPVIPGAETRLVQKVVNRVVVEVADSNSFSAGPDFNSLHEHEWKSRRTTDGYGPQSVTSEAAELRIRGGWGPSGRVCIRQTKPFPLTVLGITREVTLGDS